MANTYTMSNGDLEWLSREGAGPLPGEVAVEVLASSINYRDLAIRAGFYPSTSGVVPLSDGAGRVMSVGDGVTELKPGDLVASCFYPFWEAGPRYRSESCGKSGL